MTDHPEKIPSLDEIEQLLHSVQPHPGERFYQRMAKAPWVEAKLHPEGDVNMKRTLYATTCALAITLLVVAIVLAVTPAGRAFAEGLFHFFARSQSNTLPLPPEQIMAPLPTSTPQPTRALALLPAGQVIALTPTPTATPEPPVVSDEMQNLTIVEARSYADFDLYEPASLPRDYRLTRIAYDPEQQAVQLFYASPQAGAGEFFQITEGKKLAPFSVGASAKVEKVNVQGQPAEFVRGQWFVYDGASESVWEDNANVYTLRWQADEITISIVFFVNEEFSPAFLTQAEMLAAGESLARCDTADANAYYACQVKKAATAAGFTPLAVPGGAA